MERRELAQKQSRTYLFRDSISKRVSARFIKQTQTRRSRIVYLETETAREDIAVDSHGTIHGSKMCVGGGK